MFLVLVRRSGLPSALCSLHQLAPVSHIAALLSELTFPMYPQCIGKGSRNAPPLSRCLFLEIVCASPCFKKILLYTSGAPLRREKTPRPG
mmetsp:Transcript_12199/g.24315  ORF Transcript_12199/g.24315 Transcript_12199/m.24315 type:complete len:90 (+) Transcript_12199:48-317(+)